MERNFETVMIEQCAPTLAGLKPANLFRLECRDRAALYARVEGWNAALNPKGVRLLVLKECPHTCCYLVYVYRAPKLWAELSRPETRAFLSQEGYRLPGTETGPAGCAALLEQLAGRLGASGQFPHEIGVFLGYPLGDVLGFIQNQGKNFTCCGCWKAYGDPAAAQRIFDQFQKCTAIYLRLFHSGRPSAGLSVAA